jgi:hypothetical protein
MKVARDLDAEARATFTDDKAVGLGRIAPAPGESPATTEQVPVLLLEPRTAMMMANPETGEVTEGQVDAIIKAGLQRLTWPAALVEPTAGWTLQRTADGIELRDAHGGPWVRCVVLLEPRWVSAAVGWGRSWCCTACGWGSVSRPTREAAAMVLPSAGPNSSRRGRRGSWLPGSSAGSLLAEHPSETCIPGPRGRAATEEPCV